jgi:Polyketide cyclase / dehydrase and lipid transport
MADSTASKDIAVSIDQLWSVVTDLSRWSEWNTMLTQWKGRVPDTLAPGTRVTAVLAVLGMENTYTFTVDDFNPPTLLSLSGEGLAGAHGTYTIALERVGDHARVNARVAFANKLMVGAIGRTITEATDAELQTSLGKLAALVG